MFFTYGLTSRMPHTSLPFGCDKKQLSIASPAVSLGQGNKPDRSAYRPPHLRKRDCSNLKHNRIHHSQCLVEDNDSTAIVTSSDSDFSDGDGPAKECDSVLNSRVRVAAVICVQVNECFDCFYPPFLSHVLLQTLKSLSLIGSF